MERNEAKVSGALNITKNTISCPRKACHPGSQSSLYRLEFSPYDPVASHQRPPPPSRLLPASQHHGQRLRSLALAPGLLAV